ncbi:MAG: glycosyltransferase family 4 protein [Candidatus Binatia bacterium]
MQDTLRLLWLTEHYYPGRGGMAESCERIVRGLQAAGVVVDVAFLSRRAPRCSVTSLPKGRLLTIVVEDDPAHAMNVLWNTLQNDPQRSQWSHLIAFGGLLPFVAAPLFAAWLQLPLITLVRGNDFDIGIFVPERRSLLHDVFSRSAVICTVSQEKAERIAAYFAVQCVEVVHNGIPLQDWELLPSEEQFSREWRARANGRRTIGLFGNLKRKKGASFFLQTLADSILAAHFQVLIVGEVEEALVAWLATEGQQLVQHVIPSVTRYELLKYYGCCDFVAIPSFYDGLPNVALEATALGIPLLAARTGGIADVFREHEHGFFFAPGDTEQCTQALSQACHATSEQLASMSAGCRRLIADSYTTQQETDRYLAILHQTRRSV